MLLAVGDDLEVRVDVIHVSSPNMRTRNGWIRRFDDSVYHVELEDEAPDITAGSRVVLNWSEGRGRRVSATVTHRDGCRLEARERRAAPVDQRLWPRQVGGVHLRYRVLRAEEGERLWRAWMDGEDVGDGPWRNPDPFMNFSVTGLRFDDDCDCQSGDVLICELGIPGTDHAWRAAARVVRVWPVPEEEREAGSTAKRVAVQFTELPTDAAEALTHYTLRLQRSTL